MEKLFSLGLLTISYGLLILSIIPDKYLRKKNSYLDQHKKIPEYLNVSLSIPIFFSLLLGYTLASIMLYFVVT